MKILVVSDEELPGLWDYYRPEKLQYDLILSCGDLKAEYLEFLVTMARCPVLYVPGNHDERYTRTPPEGCDCIDGGIVEYNGVRFVGLGGCRKYRPGTFQRSERKMEHMMRKLRWKLKRLGGFDVLVTHASPEGIGDGEDYAHRGFACFLPFLDKYRPPIMVHGHVHLFAGAQRMRERSYGSTRIINCCGSYELILPDREVPPEKKDILLWHTRDPIKNKKDDELLFGR